MLSVCRKFVTRDLVMSFRPIAQWWSFQSTIIRRSQVWLLLGALMFFFSNYCLFNSLNNIIFHLKNQASNLPSSLCKSVTFDILYLAVCRQCVMMDIVKQPSQPQVSYYRQFSGRAFEELIRSSQVRLLFRALGVSFLQVYLCHSLKNIIYNLIIIQWSEVNNCDY